MRRPLWSGSEKWRGLGQEVMRAVNLCRAGRESRYREKPGHPGGRHPWPTEGNLPNHLHQPGLLLSVQGHFNGDVQFPILEGLEQVASVLDSFSLINHVLIVVRG